MGDYTITISGAAVWFFTGGAVHLVAWFALARWINRRNQENAATQVRRGGRGAR